MKKLSSLIALVFCAVAITSVGWATAVPACADVSSNAATVYTNYGSQGCTIGDKTFSNFQFTNSAVWTGITPLNPDSMHEGFQFGGAFLTTGSIFVASVSYDVAVTSGAPLIDDMALSIGGVGQIPSGVVFSVGEDIFGNTAHTVLLGSLEVGNLNPPTKFSDTASWAPVNFIHVSKDVTIAPCGTTTPCTTGFNFSEITQMVSQVPEPMTFSLMGAGLLGLGLLRKRIGRS